MKIDVNIERKITVDLKLEESEIRKLIGILETPSDKLNTVSKDYSFTLAATLLSELSSAIEKYDAKPMH